MAPTELYALNHPALAISIRRNEITRPTAKTGSGVMNKIDFAVGIGGENGQGIASTGNILALIFARRGLHLNAYNAYQSIIRGGHTFLTIRAGDGPVRNMGDKIDVFIQTYELWQRHVTPVINGANEARETAFNWARDNKEKFIGAAMSAAMQTIQKHHEAEAKKATKAAE